MTRSAEMTADHQDRPRGVWRPIDAIGEWLRRSLGYKAQLRIAVLLLLITIPLFPLIVVVPESWREWLFRVGVWLMSVAALTYTSMGVIAGVEAAREASERS